MGQRKIIGPVYSVLLSLSFISLLFSLNDRGLIDAYLIRAIVEFILFFHHSSYSRGNEKVRNEKGKTV